MQTSWKNNLTKTYPNKEQSVPGARCTPHGWETEQARKKTRKHELSAVSEVMIGSPNGYSFSFVVAVFSAFYRKKTCGKTSGVYSNLRCVLVFWPLIRKQKVFCFGGLLLSNKTLKAYWFLSCFWLYFLLKEKNWVVCVAHLELYRFI
jgi:hypothetical protein